MGTIYKTNGFLHVILVNNCQRIPKGQSQMDNSEKVATYRVHETKRNKAKTQHVLDTTIRKQTQIT